MILSLKIKILYEEDASIGKEKKSIYTINLCYFVFDYGCTSKCWNKL